MSSSGAAARDGRLKVGMRILEVGNHSLLGMTHTEAVRVLRSTGDTLVMLVCDGFDPRTIAGMEVNVQQVNVATHTHEPDLNQNQMVFFFSLSFAQASPGVIANPFAAGIVRKNSMESISSIDRDLSPEEMDIMQKVSFLYIGL